MVEKTAAAMINGSSVTSLAITAAVNCSPVEAPTTSVPAGRPHGISRTGAPASDSADDAGGERACHGERGRKAFRHTGDRSVHVVIVLVTARLRQIHRRASAAGMPVRHLKVRAVRAPRVTARERTQLVFAAPMRDGP